MTSSEIRQSFLDFFKSKQHTIVPSSSLMPDSPNLLFTNAGMNQFVPIFLGQTQCPYAPPRAADTQKCIRAGGKHNDLDDVGLDTYHHTFFEMLGNWSFGDYFKKEAIDWAWELVTEVWKFPKNRLYATVYSPDKSKGDPSGFDQEAYDLWAAKFHSVWLDPKEHIVYGNKKDNFWMMGETGPCGPCSELHVDLTPNGDTKGKLVNKGSADCIEIWNLVFIQFNANPDGTFSPLPARHVDTGMGFERASSIIQCTENFTDFSGIISNYETDIFRPIFDRLEKMSGKKYGSTLPNAAGVPLAAGPGEHTRPRVSLPAPSRSASETSNVTGTKYSRRNLPHFERPWAKYMVSFSTVERRQLTPAERDLAMLSILYAHEHRQYQLYAACVMPDHVHLIFEPQIKEQDKDGNPIFWSLSEILQGVKSASAHEINKASGGKGSVWEKESMDRLIRGDADMEEKFHYVCRNPWDAGVVPQTENYPWLWTPEAAAWAEGARDESPHPEPTAGARSAARGGACAPRDQEQEKIDVAFRVIADHIRTLSFAIADGIQPGNNDRNYVLRRILRRAVRYGRTLGFHEPFFYKLVDVLADTMGNVFPEIRAKKMQVQETIQREEEAFNKTLDNGIEIFENSLTELNVINNFLHTVPFELEKVRQKLREASQWPTPKEHEEGIWESRIMTPIKSPKFTQDVFESLTDTTRQTAVTKLIIIKWAKEWSELWEPVSNHFRELEKLIEYPNAFAACQEKILNAIAQMEAELPTIQGKLKIFPGRVAFKLYDTYGFPLDLTELMARERGLIVDIEDFNKLMEEQRTRARAAQKKEVISLSQIETTTPTKFVGYNNLQTSAKVLEVVSIKDKTAVVIDTSPMYAEMGGQVGDTGEIIFGSHAWPITNTQKSGNTWLHITQVDDDLLRAMTLAQTENSRVIVSVDRIRRNAIQRHHTVTHLLHWALHEVVSKEATQKGSFVGPDKLTFDFNSAALTLEQVEAVEKLVNEKILENASVSWTEVPHADVKNRKDVMQFFGDKYGDAVRVVQIGGTANKLDGYSMELCGGTHTRATGEIGLFRIVSEAAVAAGVRRIEAVAGLEAVKRANNDLHLIKTLGGKLSTPIHELEKKVDALLAQQKELEKKLKSEQQRSAAARAKEFQPRDFNGIPAIIENIGEATGDELQTFADAIKTTKFNGIIVLGGVANGAVSLIAVVPKEFTDKIQAGKIIQTIAPIVGGKGGGKPDNARGGGKDATKLDEALAAAKAILAG